jgi:hypothetical protein
MSPDEVEDLTDLDTAAALEKGQETADTDRAAVEAAFAALRSPLGRSRSVRCVSAGKSPGFRVLTGRRARHARARSRCRVQHSGLELAVRKQDTTFE